MQDKKTSLMYKILKPLVKLVYPKFEVVGKENLPNQPAVIVGNHSQNYGPIASEFYFPEKRYIWAAGAMFKCKDVPSYAYKDFWSNKPRRSRWYYKIMSYVIAPISVCVFNNAHTIPVYRDKRIITTFRETGKALKNGAHVIIFPEHNIKHNHILYDFEDRFIDLARVYHKRTGIELSFVPMYIAPRLKKMYICKPIRFNSANPIDEERERIKQYLMQEIIDTACALPVHTVVPYRNIPRKDYPLNKTKEK